MMQPPPGTFGVYPPAQYAGGEWPTRRPRRNAKDVIEAMIAEYRLAPSCAWVLRSLPPDRQKVAARIDPSGKADPSAYVAEQLEMIV